jgi:diaminopimelate decarboxylase
MSYEYPNLTEKDNQLHMDSLPLKQVAKTTGTPVYVFSSKGIFDNIKTIQDAFKTNYPKTEIAYSLKNNMLYDVTALIAKTLTNFEVTSLFELDVVEKAVRENKLENARVITTNLYKSDALLEKLLSLEERLQDYHKVDISSLIAIDSYSDLRNTERVAKKLGKKASVLIRINPGIKMSKKEAIFASALPTSKCSVIIQDIEPIIESSKEEGISEWLIKRETKLKKDYAENLIALAEASPYLELEGLHGHLGSQITNIDYFHYFFEVVVQFFKLTEETLHRGLPILDLGGGYPVQYHARQKIPEITTIAKSIATKLKRKKTNPLLLIESGRFITANAAVLLSQINLIKEQINGRKLAILDLSVYSDLLDVLVASWDFDALLVNDLSGQEKPTKFQWELVGATNDTLDQLQKRTVTCSECSADIVSSTNHLFSRDLREGDLIAIPNAGAYTTCFNSNYCGRTKPKAILLDQENTQKFKRMQ